MQIEPALKALADPTRLRIMRLLARLELAVGELAQLLDQSQPRISRHVRILCDAGLAERRREGSWVFTRSLLAAPRGDAAVDAVTLALARLLDSAERADQAFGEVCAADRRRLGELRAAREARAASYFAAHATEWDTLRTLHGDDGPVEEALLDILGAGSLGALLDIGTGTGRIAQLLSDRAERIVAFDKSLDMLRLARARLQNLPAARLELVQGDFATLPFDPKSFDTVTLHQVLHYAQAPETVLAEAARVTVPGGRIAVVDLAAHTREDLRERHAHVRLGFADRQMDELMKGAGFAPAERRTIAGQKLAVSIWIGTRRADSITPIGRAVDPLPVPSSKVAAR